MGVRSIDQSDKGASFSRIALWRSSAVSSRSAQPEACAVWQASAHYFVASQVFSPPLPRVLASCHCCPRPSSPLQPSAPAATCRLLLSSLSSSSLGVACGAHRLCSYVAGRGRLLPRPAHPARPRRAQSGVRLLAHTQHSSPARPHSSHAATHRLAGADDKAACPAADWLPVFDTSCITLAGCCRARVNLCTDHSTAIAADECPCKVSPPEPGLWGVGNSFGRAQGS